MKNWLSKNKEWFFSGAGVALISATIPIVWSLSIGNRVSDQPEILSQSPPTTVSTPTVPPTPKTEKDIDTRNVSSDECKINQNLVDAFAEGVYNYRQGKSHPDPIEVARDYEGRSRQEYNCFYLGHLNASLFIVR